MINDKVQIKKEREDIQKQKSKELVDIIKPVLPLMWKYSIKTKEDGYALRINIRGGAVIGGITADPSLLFGLKISPIYDDHETLRGVVVYPDTEREDSGYGMAKKFAKKFEKRYLGRYIVEIRP